MLATFILQALIFSVQLSVDDPVCFGGQTVSAKAAFSDLSQKHWAYADVMTLAASSYIGGYPDGRFQPEGTITRAEFTSIVVRILGLSAGVHAFTDVSESNWANGAIGAAVKAGVIDAAEYGNAYKPATPITRLEMAKMIARALATDSSYASVLDEYRALYQGDLPFVDARNLADGDVRYLALAYGTRVMGGYPDASFGPDRSATRAEAAVMLHNFLKAKQQSPADFQYVNEMLAIADTGMNAVAISTLEPKVNLLDGDTLIQHASFDAKLKRAYVIPIKGDTVSMYERKFVWDRTQVPEGRLDITDGLVVGVADVTFKKGGNGWVYAQHRLILSSAFGLFYYEPELRFGLQTEVMKGRPEYESGKTYELVFYAHYNDDIHNRWVTFRVNNALNNSASHDILLYPK